MRYLLFLLIVSFSFLQTKAQNTGVFSGIILDKQLQKPIQGAVVKLVQVDQSVVTDSAGKFQFNRIKSGYYTFIFSALGYSTQSKFNVTIASGNENTMVIELESTVQELAAVTVNSTNRNKSAKAATLETPLSVQRLTSEEIKANPGGNFDISRVIQALPGVGGSSSTAGFRNDIIIRGGAPNENVFYLDGIEIPVINHFATQGSAGGPTGILNVSFIEEVKLSSSAFDARFDNTLSSVFEFKQKRGNNNRVQGNIRLSGTELATTFDGPIGKSGKTTFLASARRSYLQLLFKAIDLPIRPNYWDFQYKITHQLNKKTTLTLLGVGAIDEFNFAAPKEATPEKLYVLNSNPSIQQWNYTVGASIRRQLINGYWNLAISRNAFNNQLEKYENNLGPIRGIRTIALNSSEVENKLRFDVNQNINGFKLSYGFVAQLVSFSNNTNQLISNAIVDNNNNIVQPAVVYNFNSKIQFARMGAFTQIGKRFLENKLGLSAGIRFDQNTFTQSGMNPFKTLSPRIAASYVITDKLTFNASIGTYFKMLPYTALGYRNNNNELINKNTDYTRSTHYVAGFEYLPSSATRFTFEGFYKQYNNVPISVRNGISLSNQGADFNVLGNEAVSTTGRGKAYGFEFFAQQKLTQRFYGVLSYTWFVSKYTNANNTYAPSSWDNRHLLSAVIGYKMKRNWEIGLKFRYQGGVPFTPYDLNASRQNYLALGTGTLDYNNINTQRLNAFNSSDIRIDKKWYYKRFTLDLFVDITNWYLASSPAQDVYTFQRNADNTGFITTNGQPIQSNGSNAEPFLLRNNDRNVTPTIGFIIEF
ncbi:TonB-dependent receptor [Sediminibacterium sp.]|uniref:TonB-dependent receptor n=1 Tax=Sediminibacterium sp. TaxID=1917865 RepID=UPI0027361371|nr:TonB-dependent receptor [Sediminibacterium sp.]MDP3393618.1 TonB-dependent receptor [Sediminibacterium sp.]MDP3566610.1 TonB-dependent receptor [Sediminibacterium sp.]